MEYAYDDLFRLTQENIFDALDGNRTIDYTYDLVGNRLSRDDSLDGLTTYDYDDNDRLLSETTGGAATEYTYDDNGNTLSKISDLDRVFYEWNIENRLAAADTDGDGTNDISYEFDTDGIRVSQTTGGEETRFLIDKNRPFAQVLEEYTPGGIIKVSYVHGLDLISQNRPATTGKSFFHVDGLGSTRALTNGSGVVTDRYIYDAFGRTIGQIGSTGNVYLFAGEQRDLATGLDYLRARYLDTGTGRFFGRDPFQGFHQQPMSLHRFLYANANPVNNTDPSGEVTLMEVVITTAIVSILATTIQQSFAKVFEDILEPTEWKGSLFLASAGVGGPPSNSPLSDLFKLNLSFGGLGGGFGGILVESVCEGASVDCDKEVGQGVILGFSWSFGLGTSIGLLESEFFAVTPGVFGKDPSLFSGGFNLGTAGIGASLGKFSVKIGPSIGTFVSGFSQGALTNSLNANFGVGIGVGVFSGFSIVWDL